MGLFDMPCPICGVNLSGPEPGAIKNKQITNWLKQHASELKWLDELVAVPLGADVYYGRYDGYGQINGVNIDATLAVGLHKACWELAGKPIFQQLQAKGIVSSSEGDYLEQHKEYAEQFFDWEAFIADGLYHRVALWTIIDPLRTDLPDGLKNRRRILDAIEAKGLLTVKPPSPKKVSPKKVSPKKISPKPAAIHDRDDLKRQLKELRESGVEIGIALTASTEAMALQLKKLLAKRKNKK